MNLKQHNTIWLATAIIVLMGVVPPWRFRSMRAAGYALIFSPPPNFHSIDVARLCIEWFVVSVICGVLLIYLVPTAAALRKQKNWSLLKFDGSAARAKLITSWNDGKLRYELQITDFEALPKEYLSGPANHCFNVKLQDRNGFLLIGVPVGRQNLRVRSRCSSYGTVYLRELVSADEVVCRRDTYEQIAEWSLASSTQEPPAALSDQLQLARKLEELQDRVESLGHQQKRCAVLLEKLRSEQRPALDFEVPQDDGEMRTFSAEMVNGGERVARF